MSVTARNRAAGALLSLATTLSLFACGGAPNEPLGSDKVDTARGTLIITLHMSGNSVDFDGITVNAGGNQADPTPGNPVTFTLSPGPYVVTLTGVADHCALATRNMEPIIVANKTDTLNVEVACIGGLAYVAKAGPAEFQLRYLGENGRTVQLTSTQGRLAILGWSPDGQRVLFSNDADGHAHLYSVQRDGAGQLQLTTGTTDDSRARYSPDGARIAYTARNLAAATTSVVVMNADGSGSHTIPAAMDPAWSADGSQLFFSCSASGHSSLCTSAADGSGVRAITVPAIEALYAECTTGSSSACGAPAPQSWDVSPDGRKLSFTTSRSPSLGPQSVWTSAIDGLGAKVVAPTGIISFSAQWAPTSDWMALGVFPVDPGAVPFGSSVGAGVSTVKPDGTSYHMLSPSWTINDQTPAIAPDGTLIAFVNGNNILVMNPDGTGRHDIARGTLSQPVWNPTTKPGGPFAQ